MPAKLLWMLEGRKLIFFCPEFMVIWPNKTYSWFLKSEKDPIVYHFVLSPSGILLKENSFQILSSFCKYSKVPSALTTLPYLCVCVCVCEDLKGRRGRGREIPQSIGFLPETPIDSRGCFCSKHHYCTMPSKKMAESAE